MLILVLFLAVIGIVLIWSRSILKWAFLRFLIRWTLNIIVLLIIVRNITTTICLLFRFTFLNLWQITEILISEFLPLLQIAIIDCGMCQNILILAHSQYLLWFYLYWCLLLPIFSLFMNFLTLKVSIASLSPHLSTQHVPSQQPKVLIIASFQQFNDDSKWLYVQV